MLTFILGGCGTGKSTKMMEHMQQDLANGKDVLVLVPEQFSFEEEKKLYRFLGASDFNRLKTFSFATLSRHILQQYGSNARAERYASDREKLIFLFRALRNTVKRGDLKILGRRSDSSEFVGELLSLFVKLRKAGVTSQQLLDAAPALPERLSEKTSDIAMLLFEYDCILKENGLYDSLTDLSEAAMIANIQGFFKGKTLYIDEFDSFTGDQYSMLDVILAQADDVLAAIRTDEPEAKISPIFEGGNRTYRALENIAKNDYHIPVEVLFCDQYQRSAHADLCAVSTRILRPQTTRAEYSGHVHILDASDPIGEAEYIGATICRLLSEDSTLRCRDIAVAVKSLDAYGSVLRRAFERYGLPYHMSVPKPVLHTELMRHFLALLELLADSSWNTEIILRYLKTPFSGYETVSISMLEHFCFTWSIEKDEWLQPFYDENSDNTERARPFGGAHLEKTRERAVSEIQHLKKACSGKTVRKICEELYRHLCCKQAAWEKQLDPNDTLLKREFAMLWNMLTEMIDTVVSCCGEQELGFAELYEIFRLQIGSSSFATPPQMLDSIQIVEAQTARLNAPAVVFVPGVCENAFPGEIKMGGMFTRQELEQLSESGIAITRMFFELYSDERLIVHKLFSAPSSQLYLSCPRVNAAGESVKPSMVIRQITAMFPGVNTLTTREEEIPLTYFVRTPASAYFHYVRNLRRDDGELAALRQILERDPLYAAKLRKLVEVDTVPQFQVSPESMRQFLGDCITLSPSRIETFYSCPFQYFCGSCLHLYAPEKVVFSDQNIGNFAHFCFEQILRKYDVNRFTELTASQLMEEISVLSADFSSHNFSETLRRDGRFQLNYRMAGIGLLKVLQHMQKEMKGGQFVPVGFEVSVNDRSESDLIAPLVLRDGAIRCVGKIDRVDRCDADGRTILRVVDYKTGSRIFAPEKLENGLDMQMLIYLFALKRSGVYPGSEAGGVLYMPSGQLKLKHYHDREKNVAAADILDDYYQMKGLLLDNAAPLMEPEISASCTPVLEDAKSSLYAVSEKQMEQLEQHVMDKIGEMADSLYAGEIAPKPYLNLPCGYCGCSDLCGVEMQKPVQLTKGERQQAIRAVFSDENEATEEEEND